MVLILRGWGGRVNKRQIQKEDLNKVTSSITDLDQNSIPHPLIKNFLMISH